MRRLASAVVTSVVACTVLTAGIAGDVSTDIDRHMHTIKDSRDPVKRIAAVRDLGALASPSVPGRLAGIVRRDADASLRVEAAAALGTTPDQGALGQILELAADGGTRSVRRALAGSLDARGSAPSNLATALASRKLDVFARERLIETLGSSADPMAGGQLEILAGSAAPELREAALRALCDHSVGRSVAASVLAQTLLASDDHDTIMTALELARRHGDAAIEAAIPRLRTRKSPQVDRALDNALAWITWRQQSRNGTRAMPEEALPPAAPKREDHVHVFHRGEDLARVRELIRADIARCEAREADVRIALIAYREADAKPYTMTPLQFTRDKARVEDFLAALTTQTRRPTGIGMSLAVEDALDRVAWRWDAERSVILYADARPNDGERIRTAAAVHFQADATRLSILFLDDREDEIPKGLIDAAEAGGGSCARAPKGERGTKGKDGGVTPYDDK